MGGVLTAAQQQRVRAQLLAERQAAKAALAAAKAQLRRLAKDDEVAHTREHLLWLRYVPYDGGGATARAAQYRSEWDAASRAALRATDAHIAGHALVQQLERQVAALYDPATLEARLDQRAANELRFASLRNSKGVA